MSKSQLFKYFLIFFFLLGGVSAVHYFIRRKWNFFTAVFVAGSALALFVLADAYLIEPYWIQVRRVTVHNAALAKGLGVSKLVHISDVHLTRGLGFRERQLIHKVKELNPDVVFFTGDLIDSRSQVDAALELLKSFHPAKVVGVPGDTDLSVMSAKAFQETFSPVMDTLVDEGQILRLREMNALTVAGISDARSENLSRAMRSFTGEAANLVLLSPSPDIFAAAQASGVALVLAGDTHGGQVGFDFLVRLSNYANRTPYLRGLFRKDNTQMYVNRGIGTKTRAMRFFCRPEITVIEVRP